MRVPYDGAGEIAAAGRIEYGARSAVDSKGDVAGVELSARMAGCAEEKCLICTRQSAKFTVALLVRWKYIGLSQAHSETQTREVAPRGEGPRRPFFLCGPAQRRGNVSKLPAIQFYPGDWRKDLGVQSLNFHDRGVWFEMLLLMHESEVRGKLLLGGKAMTDDTLAEVLHLDRQALAATLETLLKRGVTEREKRTGALINRRMIRDENIRAENRSRLHKWRKDKKTQENRNVDETADETRMKRLPSSSSSSSTSVSNVKAPPTPQGEGSQGEFMAATFLFEELLLAAAPSDIRLVSQVIANEAKTAKTTVEAATEFLIGAGRAGIARGETVNAFWFRDRKFAQESGNGKNHRSGAKERLDRGGLALANALAKRGVSGPWDHAAEGAEAVAEPGHRGVDRGVSGGLRATRGEVLDPESRGGS